MTNLKKFIIHILINIAIVGLFTFAYLKDNIELMLLIMALYIYITK